MNTEHWIDGKLESLRKEDLDRRLVMYPVSGGKLNIGDRLYLNFSSNDYLDLSNHPLIIQAATEAAQSYGTGSGASRLLTGTLRIHDELETQLAKFKKYPATLLFGSGYMANAGVIPAIVGRNDVVFADRLAHASILDAIALSRARLHRFRHNDVENLNDLLARYPHGRKLIVTESVFSMNGDLAPLREIAGLAAHHEALLMVDEAHAIGVFGPQGGGLVREWELERSVNLCVGTLSKAMGSYGGFVTCSERMKELLINRSRALIYSTAPPPPALGAAMGALALLAAHPALPTILLNRAALFRGLLERAGLNTLNSQSQIVPVLMGSNAKALDLSRRLRERGILAIAIRPPTIPQGSARLRFSITLAHTEEDLIRAANIVIAEAQSENLT